MPAPGAGTPPRDASFLRGGETGALIRATDWSATALGPAQAWPQSLRTALNLCVSSRFPIALYWGPDYLMLYNDDLIPMVGANKHPAAMGRPAFEVLAEIRGIIEPLLDRVVQTGEAIWSEDLMLPLVRGAAPEESYFTFTYSPIFDEVGGVGGVFCAVLETTDKIIEGRRLRLLNALATTAQGRTPAEACARAADELVASPNDLPFALLYLLDGSADVVRLAGQTSLADPALAPPAFELDGRAPWPFNPAQLEPAAVPLVAGPNGARGAVIFPIAHAAGGRPHGFLVAGLSPMLADGPFYLRFLNLLAASISQSVSNAAAYHAERERAEALAEIDRAKTAFFSNISHEFRTPLTLMLGPVQDALGSPSRTLGGDELASVHRNTLRLLKLVNALLDFARVQAGRATAAYEPTDLAALTSALSSAFRSAIERGGVRFDVDCLPLPEPIFVDRPMWEKIILNLLSNALKFTFEGTIRVAQRLIGEHVVVEVQDSGVGIPAHEMPRLFERFHRAEGVQARTQEGSGIGLALVQDLVRLHGGTIDAVSAVGQGTTFRIAIPRGHAHLPAAEVATRATARSDADVAEPFVSEALRWVRADGAAPEPAPGAARPHVLIADDNADMREYLARLLGPHWSIQLVSDGLLALAAVQQRRPDLVITDLMMPGLDGVGLLQALRGDEATKHVPVIALSARAGEEARVEGLRLGFDEYIVKPFSANELVVRVEALLARVALRAVADLHRRRMVAVLESAPVGIAILRGREQRFELANATYLALVPDRPVVGKTLREVFPELATQGIFEMLDGVFTTGERFVARARRLVLVRQDDGRSEERFFDWVYQAMRDEHGVVEGIIVVAFEVTDLALARRAAESANRAKDEFMAILGHELRNPLAPILTAVQLMRMRGVAVVEKERAVIERQAEHLVRLVDDLLDVSRIATGKVELKRARVELGEVMAKALEMASPLLEQRQHEVVVEVAPHGLVVEADPGRLAQVFSNLLTNAAKYTEPGGEIRIAAAREGARVVARVRDTGIGISAEMLPRVFDLFSQERQALDRARGGLGLGLSIVKSLVALHDGEVRAHSAGHGQGSEFVVELPVAIAAEDDAMAAPTRAAAAEGPSAADRPRVLVVDDNVDAADMLSESLELLGYATRVAYDGPSALRAVASFTPDVALLDIGLPAMDGYELARLLRQQPELAGLGLVAVTGYGQEEDRQRAQAAGFDTHLVKPVDLVRLRAALGLFAALARREA